MCGEITSNRFLKFAPGEHAEHPPATHAHHFHEAEPGWGKRLEGEGGGCASRCGGVLHRIDDHRKGGLWVLHAAVGRSSYGALLLCPQPPAKLA